MLLPLVVGVVVPLFSVVALTTVLLLLVVVVVSRHGHSVVHGHSVCLGVRVWKMRDVVEVSMVSQRPLLVVRRKRVVVVDGHL